jgi:hypothetical protein
MTMKKLFVVLAALLVMVTLGSGQMLVKETVYRVPVVVAETDTVPGTEVGGIGASGTGWLYVGNNMVKYSITGYDSAHFKTYVDYADSGWAPAANRSAGATGFMTIGTINTAVLDTRGAGPLYPGTAVLAPFNYTCTDSVIYCPDVANPTWNYGRVLRGPVWDLMPGGKWIRFRILGITKHVVLPTKGILKLTVTQEKW